MKTLLMFGSFTALALSAFAVELTSSNVLGIQASVKKSNDAYVAVPFEAIGGGDAKLSEILYTDNLSMADTVMLMQDSSDSSYMQWIWLPGFMDELYWTQRRNSQVKVESMEQVVKRGIGLRLSLANGNAPVYTLGQYTGVSLSSSINKGTTTMFVNPYTRPINLETDFLGVFKAGDRIVIQNGAVELSYSYSTTPNSEGRHWYRPSTDGNQYDLPDSLIAPGQFFRFNHAARLGADVLTVSW